MSGAPPRGSQGRLHQQQRGAPEQGRVHRIGEYGNLHHQPQTY